MLLYRLFSMYAEQKGKVKSSHTCRKIYSAVLLCTNICMDESSEDNHTCDLIIEMNLKYVNNCLDTAEALGGRWND